MTPIGNDLDQYKAQAKDLLRQARVADIAAIDRIRASHPEHDRLIASGKLQLADTQLVVARENDFPSWAKFKGYLVFCNAVQALDTGDVETLGRLLNTEPALIAYRCRTGGGLCYDRTRTQNKGYESGYFAGATLLHHVAGNPARCPLPPNIADVTRLLLARGADPNAHTDDGSTTITLLLTSRQASEAGVALPLIEMLIAAGATRDEVDDGGALSLPLWNGGRATAEAMVQSGARMEIRHAAALGRIDVLGDMLAQPIDASLLEEALIYAAAQNELPAARLLVQHGAKGDVIAPPGHRLRSLPAGYGDATALHNAAYRGNNEIVALLLESGASPDVVEEHYFGTAAQWAQSGNKPDTVALLRPHMKPETAELLDSRPYWPKKSEGE